MSSTEIERLAITTLRQIRILESSLCHRFQLLAEADREAPARFYSSLQDLEKKTTRLEGLIEALDARRAA